MPVITMANSGSTSVLVFGDQSVNSHTFLKEIIHRSRESIHSTTFLREANRVLRDEVSKLPVENRASIPSFSTIQELNLRYQASEQVHAGLDGALLCIAQLAHFIRFVSGVLKVVLTADVL